MYFEINEITNLITVRNDVLYKRNTLRFISVEGLVMCSDVLCVFIE